MCSFAEASTFGEFEIKYWNLRDRHPFGMCWGKDHREAVLLDVPDFARARGRMVETQIARRGVSSPLVLAAMREVPREAFVDEGLEEFAYEDNPLPIAENQTISQPFIVALMIEACEVRPTDRVLEVGVGSGYAMAVLSRIAARVHGVERHPSLTAPARQRLDRLGYHDVELRTGDGTRG